jgi:hypothetical protein
MNLRDERDPDSRLWYQRHSLRPARHVTTILVGDDTLRGIAVLGYPCNHNPMKSPQERRRSGKPVCALASVLKF